jgi:hypothetical protein
MEGKGLPKETFVRRQDNRLRKTKSDRMAFVPYRLAYCDQRVDIARDDE